MLSIEECRTIIEIEEREKRLKLEVLSKRKGHHILSQLVDQLSEISSVRGVATIPCPKCISLNEEDVHCFTLEQCKNGENQKLECPECKELIPTKNFFCPEETISQNCEYDIFLSHKQSTGGDLAGRIKAELLLMHPDLRVFLDVDDLKKLHDLEVFVNSSKNFVVLITEGLFESKWVQLEVETAVRANKNIILVMDENVKFPDVSNQSEAIKNAFKNKAIKFHREIKFRQVSLQSILDELV